MTQAGSRSGHDPSFAPRFPLPGLLKTSPDDLYQFDGAQTGTAEDLLRGCIYTQLPAHLKLPHLSKHVSRPLRVGLHRAMSLGEPEHRGLGCTAPSPVEFLVTTSRSPPELWTTAWANWARGGLQGSQERGVTQSQCRERRPGKGQEKIPIVFLCSILTFTTHVPGQTSILSAEFLPEYLTADPRTIRI